MLLTYDASPFEVPDIASARAIILTPTPEGKTTEERWEVETEYLTGLIIECCKIGPESKVLDYGCGIGRLSKSIIGLTGATVVGIDASEYMLSLAEKYVASDRFIATPSTGFDFFEDFDVAIAVWALQHAKDPRMDLVNIVEALKPEGKFFVVNEKRRCVPTKELGWVDDGFDVRMALDFMFPHKTEGVLMPSKVGEATSNSAFWAVYS